jgi:ankyrin repeat protein
LAAEARLVGRFARLIAAESSEEDKNPVDGRDFTPLHVAAGNGCLEIVDVIVASVSDRCPRDSLQRTPLHWAAMFGHTQIVENLLAVAAEKNPEDGFGHIRCDNLDLELALSAFISENGTDGRCKVHFLIVSPKC